MDILTLKEASEMWGISVRRITELCNQGRILGARKVAGIWLLPTNTKKPADARVKTGKYKDWRNTTTMSSSDFENNLRNLRGTLAVENINISATGMDNLKRIESGAVNYKDVIEELKLKYMQRN